MDRIDITATMGRLLRMDEDAMRLYQAAFDRVSDDGLKRQLQEFAHDHERHAQDIARYLKQMGWERMRPSAEFERLMAGFMNQVQQAGSTDEVMAAVELAERATNAEYAEALKLDIDLRSREMLQRSLADERRHLAWAQSRTPVGVVAGRGGALPPDTGGAGPMGGMGGDVGPGGGGPASWTAPESRDTGPSGDVTTDRGEGTRRPDELPFEGS